MYTRNLQIYIKTHVGQNEIDANEQRKHNNIHILYYTNMFDSVLKGFLSGNVLLQYLQQNQLVLFPSIAKHQSLN